eukprot:TRINITY_DN48726_c0_g1_i1.p1 TRINITY_DN48726_c0_g1~~TRINITY_DN48726_c0_g1_i1.p1  ORF type:complete len:493 (+),score=104.08 TRINITY_DN48726_c0_g1_i1:148-1626(+)
MARRLMKSSSRPGMGPWDEVGALVQASNPRSAGCTCGAAEQLEEERQRLDAQCRAAAERAGSLALQEGHFDQRSQMLESCERELKRFERAVCERRESAADVISQREGALREVEQREEAVTKSEQELQGHAAWLEDLEREVLACEEALAREEFDFMDERNRDEDELARLRRERSELRAQAATRDAERDECQRWIEEVERERDLLAADEQLLAEIQEQVGPTRRSLHERETRLGVEEVDLRAREADLDEREARVLPEYHWCLQNLNAAEERARELRGREEESERQRLRLLRRQRDLGGAEIRLSGLEGAVRHQQGPASASCDGSDKGAFAPANSTASAGVTLACSVATGNGSVDQTSHCSPEEMQACLMRLRRADADWAERVRSQQCEIQRLEARAAQLEALASGKSSDGATGDITFMQTIMGIAPTAKQSVIGGVCSSVSGEGADASNCYPFVGPTAVGSADCKIVTPTVGGIFAGYPVAHGNHDAQHGAWAR